VPTYQYACTVCGHRLEAVQSFSDDPLTECPECAGRLRKLFSAVGIVFKGSGFYRNDSRPTGSSGSSDSSGKEPAKEPAAASAASGSSSSSASSSTSASTPPSSSSTSPAAKPST